MRKQKKCLFEDRHEEMGKGCEFCFACHQKIGLSYEAKMEQKTNAIPVETRQKFMDLIFSGKSIGEAREAVGLESEIAIHIVGKQIGEYHYLKKEIV